MEIRTGDNWDHRIGNTWFRVENGTLLACGPSDQSWREASPEESDEFEFARLLRSPFSGRTRTRLVTKSNLYFT